MKLVVDANILFAALIKQGLTAELMISDKLQLFAPEFLFNEFSKYVSLILKKTNRSKDEFFQFLEILREQITVVLKEDIIPYIHKAEKSSPDPKDTIYLALALAIKSDIWSNDKKIRKQNKIEIFSTHELFNLVR